MNVLFHRNTLMGYRASLCKKIIAQFSNKFNPSGANRAYLVSAARLHSSAYRSATICQR